MKTKHQIIIGNSQNLNKIADNTINLVVTSPPYPMIEMWDETFKNLNPDIDKALKNKDGNIAYNLMHKELNKVWEEVNRILVDGGIVCINIGDATRKLGDVFQLYSNHSRIIQFFENKNYQVLPDILWRKQSNKPNKFMGSGMLPPNAYVTLEHEYILIFRKKGNRIFKSKEEKINRQDSAYFWEERNQWFSDMWDDVKGTSQNINNKKLRVRNGAYPFEIPYRLINMYSVKGDLILDPFLGTGTTTIAAIASERNSIGYEIDANFEDFIKKGIIESKDDSNDYISNRFKNHINFVNKRTQEKGPLKHFSEKYNFDVMTNQEKNLSLSCINKITEKEDGLYADYRIITSEDIEKENILKKENKKSTQLTFDFLS